MPRPCVRTLPSRRESPSGRPLPSARLVTFGGVIGTMSRSDSRPRLDGALRSALVPHPRRRPSRRLRSGLRSEEHTSELQSRSDLVCRLLLEKKKADDVVYTSYAVGTVVSTANEPVAA